MASNIVFSREDYRQRIEVVRKKMSEQELDALIVTNPENIYYLTGLDHQGFFAFHALLLTPDSEPMLVTREMERAIVRDMLPDVKHVPYIDGVQPLPRPQAPEHDITMLTETQNGEAGGLQPWSMSLGVYVKEPTAAEQQEETDPVRVVCSALRKAGVAAKRIGLEKSGSSFPFKIAEGIIDGLSDATWKDASQLVTECRIVQSPKELKCTRKAAEISDAMVLSGIAAAGPRIRNNHVMAAIYQTMFLRGGTYPAFVPLVRSTRTIEHEHGTWDDSQLKKGDLLFLEMAGCYKRYHAPIGRLVHIGSASRDARQIHEVCLEAMMAAKDKMKPGVVAADVYKAWQARVNKAGLEHYSRHHCGYVVGIGFPPSWSGSGVPMGLHPESRMELRSGMVFHLMSWLLRTGRGDSFISDTVVVNERGAELLTKASSQLAVR